jgi:general secretion pathway protein K
MEQSWLYAQSVNAWAFSRLYDDVNKNEIDSEADGWNYPIEPADIEGGQISAAIVDCQSKYNINNLLATGDAGKKYQDRFKRLLKVLDLPVNLIDPLMDWIDADGDIRYPGGAEDSHYMSKEKPYRSANQAISDISELRLIEGFTDDVYLAIKPYVSALPGTTNININTASEPIIRSLGEGITQQDAQYIIDSRTEEPFDGVQSFIQHQALAGRTIHAGGLSVTSNYFEVDSDIVIGNYKVGYTSIIYREDKDNIRVLRRVKKGFFDE